MHDSKSGQVVVITGASAGLGRAIAHSFARRSARIGLIARDEARLDATRREVEELGGQGLVLPLDVSAAASVDAAASQVEEAFGPIDVWVNNAMVTVFAPVSDTTAEEFRRVTDVTYLGYVYGTLSALKRMRTRDRGVIVQVGSALAYRSIPLQAAYCAAKHAMVGFTDSLRSELIHDGSNVRVTVVHMPALNTPQFGWSRSRMPRKAQPVLPIFQPEAGAEAVYRASSGEEREVLVGWPTVQAVWAQKFIPGWLDKYLADTAWEGQMFNGARDESLPDNLDAPVPGERGAHGQFDEESADAVPPLWLTTHIGGIIGGIAAGLALLVLRRR